MTVETEIDTEDIRRTEEALILLRKIRGSMNNEISGNVFSSSRLFLLFRDAKYITETTVECLARKDRGCLTRVGIGRWEGLLKDLQEKYGNINSASRYGSNSLEMAQRIADLTTRLREDWVNYCKVILGASMMPEFITPDLLKNANLVCYSPLSTDYLLFATIQKALVEREEEVFSLVPVYRSTGQSSLAVLGDFYKEGKSEDYSRKAGVLVDLNLTGSTYVPIVEALTRRYSDTQIINFNQSTVLKICF